MTPSTPSRRNSTSASSHGAASTTGSKSRLTSHRSTGRGSRPAETAQRVRPAADQEIACNRNRLVLEMPATDRAVDGGGR
jgi:hypothetical protein